MISRFLFSLALIVVLTPMAPATEAAKSNLDGRFVADDRGAIWFVTENWRYPVEPYGVTFGLMNQYFATARPTSTIPAMPAVANRAPVRPRQYAIDGRIVTLSPSTGVYILRAGYKHRIEPAPIEASDFERREVGEAVRSIEDIELVVGAENGSPDVDLSQLSTRLRFALIATQTTNPVETLALRTWRIKSPKNGQPIAVDVIGSGMIVFGSNNTGSDNYVILVARITNLGTETTSLMYEHLFLLDERLNISPLAQERIQERLRTLVNNQGKFQIAPVMTPIAPGGSTVVGLIFADVFGQASSFEFVSIYLP